MLDDFITTHRDQIVGRCRDRVATRPQANTTAAESAFGVPLFLDQLVTTLRSDGQPNPEIGRTAALHGHDLLRRGFTVSQVVHDYGDICQTITELALETNAPIDIEEFRTLNRCLDDAIAGAVTMYGREREQSSLDGQTERENQQLGFFTHELRNLVNTASVAAEALKTGNVGANGATAAVLDRSLARLRDLIGRSLAEVRITSGLQHKEQVAVAAFIEALAHGAMLEGAARGRALVVAPVDDALAIEADRMVLSSVVINLLQNAFKFSRPGGTVRLEVGASAERVLIEVHDECGGLPGGGDFKELYRPFEQRGADRTGVGLGLAFCRWGAEAHNGRLYARNLAGTGCVFTVDLPRAPVQATL